MEQGHRRPQLHRVELAEDLDSGSIGQREDESRALAQPAAEDRMLEVRPRLRERRDRVLLRRRAAAEARDLGEDEPDPVTRLAAAPELAEHSLVDALLGPNEPLEIDRRRSIVAGGGVSVVYADDRVAARRATLLPATG